MKLILLTLSFLLVFNNSCSCDKQKNKGPLHTKEFKGDFESIEVSNAIAAEIVKSDVERVVVTAPENMMEDVAVTNDGGKLIVKMKPVSVISKSSSDRVKVKIYATDFQSLEAESASSVSIKDKFLTETMKISVSSSASVQGNLEANEFHLDVSSTGTFKGNIWAVNLYSTASSRAKIEVTGKATTANIHTSSTAVFDGVDFIADAVEAEASSSSQINIGVKKSLRATANSAASINYKVIGNNIMSYQDEQKSGGTVRKIK